MYTLKKWTKLFSDNTSSAPHMYLEDEVSSIISLHENDIFSSPHYLYNRYIATAVYPIAKTKLLKFSDMSNWKALSKELQYWYPSIICSFLMNRTTQVWLYWRSQSVLNTLKTVGNSVCIKNDHAVNWENSLQHIVVLIINTNSLAWQYGAVTALHGQCTSSTRVFLYICTHLHWVEIYNTLIHRSDSHKETWVYYTLQQNISKNRLALYVSFIILRFTPTEQFNKYFFFMLCDLTSPYPLSINLTNNFCNFSNLHARV